MSVQISSAQWKGTLKEGSGTMVVGKGRWENPFTFASRFESGEETNPEELVAAAHAGCYSMFLSALISGKDLTPTSISTTAKVTLDKDDVGPKITQIELNCEAEVPGLDEAGLNELAATAKEKCPISRLYAGTDIILNIKLLETA
jgi:osmotically inducible protein OsmC